MAKLKIVPTFLPNKGIVLDKPEEFLKNAYSTMNSRNMMFDSEYLRGRYGMKKFDTAALNGAVLKIDQFWRDDSTWYLLFCTTTDIYQYDFSNTRFDILTPLYTTGTITIAAGSLDTVTGSGTTWSTNLKAGDFIKIGSGSVHTGSTWYEIASVDSDTQLTLTGDAVETSAGTAYVARQIFNGSSTNQWHAVTFQDTNFGITWIATNGVDTPIRYSGSGQVTALATVPTGFTTCRYLQVYKSRLLLMWTVEGGVNNTIRYRWSSVADCETYDDNHFEDLTDPLYDIMGTELWGDYCVIFRERDAQIVRWIGGDEIFTAERNDACAGVWAPNSIIKTELWIFYYGPDNKFHRWNMLRDDTITDDIFPYTKEFDPNMETEIFGWYVEIYDQIRWFVPYGSTNYHNACIVYNVAEQTTRIWEYQQAQATACMGEYLRTDDLYCDDPVVGEEYCDEKSGYFDDRNYLDGAPNIIAGGYDGYIRSLDDGFDDDGTDFNRIFESVRDNFKSPHRIKRLRKQQHWLVAESSGSVTVKLKKDDNNSFETTTKSISLVNSARDIIKENITLDKHAQNFKTRIEAVNHFELLGYLNYVHDKGGTER